MQEHFLETFGIPKPPLKKPITPTSEQVDAPFSDSNRNQFSNPLIPSLKTLLNDDQFDSFIIDQGIERSDRVAGYLLLQAERALRERNNSEALRLGEMASKISPLSPTPLFFLGRAVWKGGGLHLFDIASHYIAGLNLLFEDFFFLVSFLSPLLLFLVLSILFSSVTFIVYSLFSYAPIWIHQLVEFSRGMLHSIPAGLLFTVLFLAPLFIGLPILWFFLFSFVLFWGFYSRVEKGLVFVFIIGLGASAWILPFLLTLFTANSSPLLDTMSRNYRSDYLWTPPPLELTDAGWEGWFIHGAYEAQRGRYKKAAQSYKNALRQNPNSPIILNNLGNLSFYSKNYPKAVEYYQAAIKASPRLVSAYYNLSQSYREMLLFEKGESMFSKAKAINAQTTERYAKKTIRYPAFPVIEEHFTKSDLWKRIISKKSENLDFVEQVWQGLLGQVSLKKAPFISVIWIALLILSGFLYKRFFRGKQCAFCKTAICKKCTGRLFSYQVCRQCKMRFITVRKKSDFALIEDAVKRIPGRVYPLFLLPGGGHLAIQETKTAFFFLSFFYLLLCSIFIGDFLVPPTEWSLQRTESFFPVILLVLLYVVAFVDLMLKRKARKWL